MGCIVSIQQTAFVATSECGLFLKWWQWITSMNDLQLMVSRYKESIKAQTKARRAETVAKEALDKATAKAKSASMTVDAYTNILLHELRLEWSTINNLYEEARAELNAEPSTISTK